VVLFCFGLDVAEQLQFGRKTIVAKAEMLLIT